MAGHRSEKRVYSKSGQKVCTSSTQRVYEQKHIRTIISSTSIESAMCRARLLLKSASSFDDTLLRVKTPTSSYRSFARTRPNALAFILRSPKRRSPLKHLLKRGSASAGLLTEIRIKNSLCNCFLQQRRATHFLCRVQSAKVYAEKREGADSKINVHKRNVSYRARSRLVYGCLCARAKRCES